MGYIEDLSTAGVDVADVLAKITDEAPNSVMVDARGVLEYVSMIAEEIVTLAILEPENVEHYENMARPVLIIGTALRSYIELRRFEVPDTIEEVS